MSAIVWIIVSPLPSYFHAFEKASAMFPIIAKINSNDVYTVPFVINFSTLSHTDEIKLAICPAVIFICSIKVTPYLFQLSTSGLKKSYNFCDNGDIWLSMLDKSPTLGLASLLWSPTLLISLCTLDKLLLVFLACFWAFLNADALALANIFTLNKAYTTDWTAFNNWYTQFVTNWITGARAEPIAYFI